MEELARKWHTPNEPSITSEELYEWVNSHKNDLWNGHELIVGADSHAHRREYKFIEVVCIYKKGRGGQYYYTSTWEPRTKFKGAYNAKVRARLFHEVDLSVQLASNLLEHTGHKAVVHIDASPPGSKELTAAFCDQLKGYVSAYGFEGFEKPWSFCSSGIANRHSK